MVDRNSLRLIVPLHRMQFRGARLTRACHVVFLLVLCSWATMCQHPQVPVLDTPSLATEGSADLRFRRESDEGGRLLIKSANGSAVYAYDPGSEAVSLETNEVWEDASGEIGGKCGLRSGVRNGPELRIVEGKLVAGERRVRTAGELALYFNSSPDRKYLAVLSADDRFRFPDLIPFLGGRSGGPSGQHFHQLYSVPSLEPVGRPIRVGIKAKAPMDVCWTPDGRFVVYSYTQGYQMCIVGVE